MGEVIEQIKSENELDFNFENGIIVKNRPNKSIMGEIGLILSFTFGFALFLSISIIVYKYGWMIQGGYFIFDGGMMQALSVLSAFFLYFLMMKLKGIISKNLIRFIVLVIFSFVLLLSNTLLLNEYYKILIISPDVDFIIAGHALENGFTYFCIVSASAVIITLSSFKSVFFPRNPEILIKGIYKNGVVNEQVINIFRYLIGIDGIHEHEYLYQNKNLTISKKMLRKASLIIFISISSAGILLLVCGYVSFLTYLWIVEIFSVILLLTLIFMLKTLWDLKINIDQNIISETALKTLNAGQKAFIKKNLKRWNIFTLDDMNNDLVSSINPVNEKKVIKTNNKLDKKMDKKTDEKSIEKISKKPPKEIIYGYENRSKIRWMIEMMELVICLSLFSYMIYNIITLNTNNTILPPITFIVYILLVLFHNIVLNKLSKPKSILNKDKINFYKIRRNYHFQIIPYVFVFLFLNLGVGFIYFQNADMKIITGQFGFVLLIAAIIGILSILLHNYIKIKMQLGVALVLLIITFYIANNSLVNDLESGAYLATYGVEAYTTDFAQGFIHTSLAGTILGLTYGALFCSFLESGLIYVRFNSNRKIIERTVFTEISLIFSSLFGLFIGIILGKDLVLSGPHDGDFPTQFENIISMNSIIIIILTVVCIIFIMGLLMSYVKYYSKRTEVEL